MLHILLSLAMIRKFKMQVPPNNCYFASLYTEDKRKKIKNLQTSIDLSKTLTMSDLLRLFPAAAVDAGFSLHLCLYSVG